MAAPPRLIFVNLPVRDVSATTAFFGALGFDFEPKFTDESCACMIVGEQAYVMLIAESRFADFTSKPIADARVDRGDRLRLRGQPRSGRRIRRRGTGRRRSRANEPMDHGFMYGRSFNDLDGHLWEVMWMSAEAVEQGPADMAESA